jgi:hypothetical protein
MEKDFSARQRYFKEVKPMVVEILNKLGRALYGRSLWRSRYEILEYDSIFRLSLQWKPKEMVPFPVLDVTFQNSFENVCIYNPRNETSVTVPAGRAELEAAIERIAPSLYMPPNVKSKKNQIFSACSKHR